ncbi:MAG: type II toxin-antitoxin system HicA family toxin [Candidatus Competibacteraceae bacterium]|nr:MAG: type II toxin-antitoxin system HicA family toxin [Candidatus Competibacteraceae bacterium]
MTRRDKRLAAIRRNPKAVRFEDACTAVEHIGFVLRGGEGSHRVYGRHGEPTILNLQNRNGLIAEYQARQLIKMMDRYEGNA